jgi:hypothetical protein
MALVDPIKEFGAIWRNHAQTGHSQCRGLKSHVAALISQAFESEPGPRSSADETIKYIAFLTLLAEICEGSPCPHAVDILGSTSDIAALLIRLLRCTCNAALANQRELVDRALLAALHFLSLYLPDVFDTVVVDLAELLMKLQDTAAGLWRSQVCTAPERCLMDSAALSLQRVAETGGMRGSRVSPRGRSLIACTSCR